VKIIMPRFFYKEKATGGYWGIRPVANRKIFLKVKKCMQIKMIRVKYKSWIKRDYVEKLVYSSS